MTSLWAVCVCLTFGSGWALRRLGIATDNESGDATKGEAALTAEQVATLQSALADQRTHCHGLEQQVQRAGRAQHEQQRKLVEQTEQLASLRADVQSMLEEPGAPQTVVVLIDGDGYVPPKDQLASGRPGGSLAAMTLREAVERDLAESGIVADRFVVKYFCNRGESHRRASVSSDADDFEEGLVNTLKRLDGIDKSTVRQFLTGFSLEHRLSDLVDSGAQEQAADNDLRVHIRRFAPLANCRRLYLGITHDGGYAADLQWLKQEGLVDKIQIVRGRAQVAFPIQQELTQSLMVIPGLFRADCIGSPEPRSYLRHGAPADAKKVLNLRAYEGQPCRDYYLRRDGCSNDPCPFAHDLDLSTAALSAFRQRWQWRACRMENGDTRCPDSSCCYGHTCQRSAGCPRDQTCRFGTGRAFHPPPDRSAGNFLADFELYQERKRRDQASQATNAGMGYDHCWQPSPPEAPLTQ